ncbi:MAG: hypothetical protein M3R50_03070 [Bacteroidota bacterium]|nr:hypothetical protein [Bacteroidota bacterium]
MIPPNNYFDKNLDLLSYYSNVANNYSAAIKQTGIKRVVHLSSIGAHMEKNSGLIIGHHNVEEILKKIPNISLTHLRPTGFYYNLYNYIDSIKNNGFIATNDNPMTRNIGWLRSILPRLLPKNCKNPTKGEM